MRLWLARRLIDRAADDDRVLPDWVGRLTERDPELRAYDRSSRAMVRRLRQDSGPWMDAIESPDMSSNLRSHVERRARPSRRATALSVAAIVSCLALIGVLRFGPRPDDRSLVDQPSTGIASATPVELEEDLRRLAIRLAKESRPQLAALTVEPAEATGRFVGRSLALLDRSLSQEQVRITSDTRAAVESVAAGLKEFRHREN
jgi:hypothetical protein